MSDNIRGHLLIAADRLTEREIAVGRSWYPAAAHQLREIFDEFHLDAWLPRAGGSGDWGRFVSAAACISPGLSWDATLSGLRILVAAAKAEEPTYPRKGLHTTFGWRGYDRAWALLTSTISVGEVAHGPKVEAFANNLLGDLGAVTIDRHICRAAGIVGRGKARGPKAIPIPQPSAREAREIRVHLIEVARTRGLRPAEFQAALWAASARTQETV